MIKKLLTIIGILLLVLIGVLLFNTFRRKPWPVAAGSITLFPLPDSALTHLSQAIQYPTISYGQEAPIDTAAFTAFGQFLQQAYPLVHQQLQHTTIRQFSHVYQWKGRDTSAAPFVLMGHYDVVPVEPAVLHQWQQPPFSGAIKDSSVWGRGAIDDKIGVIAILESVEALLRTGYQPQRTIYLCFGHDEEIGGRAAAAVVDHLAQQQVTPALVLDEGGAIAADKIKEVERPVALISIAEKGHIAYELTVDKPGGHSSTPERETAIDILTAGLYKLRHQTTPAVITPPVSEFLDRISASSDQFLHRMAGANRWLLEPVAKSVMAAQPEGNAMIRTTLVPTIIAGGLKENVVPGHVRAVVDARILPGESVRSVQAYIENAMADKRIVVKPIGEVASEPSTITAIDGPAYKRVESAIQQTIPAVITTPYLSIGATDSRHYRRISNGVVNFMPITDPRGAHGVNERASFPDLQRCIHFITTVIREEQKKY